MAAKHILVTGYSGSGKTTFANMLSKTLGRPVIHLDNYNGGDWKRYLRDVKTDLMPELPSLYVKDSKANKDLEQLGRDLVVQAVAEPTGSIIEGSQIILMSPSASLFDEQLLFLIDIPEDRVVARRLTRDKNGNPDLVREGSDLEKERIDTAWALIDRYRERFNKWRAHPSVYAVRR